MMSKFIQIYSKFDIRGREGIPVSVIFTKLMLIFTKVIDLIRLENFSVLVTIN